jgi:membrane protein
MVNAVGVWSDRFSRNRILTYASAIAFQLLVAAGALVFLTVALLQPLGLERVWTEHVGPIVRAHLPGTWYDALNGAVGKEFRTNAGYAIGLGAAITIWEVSGAVRAVMGALNDIYEARETRSIFRRFALSFALAIGVAACLIAAVLISFVGLGLPSPIDGMIRVLVAAALCWAVIALLIRFAPAKHAPWRWVSTGSLAVVAAWIVVSSGYGYWIGNVVDFHTPEGALAALISTTGYLYASSIAFLAGAQLDQLAREGGVAGVLGRRDSR